MYIIYVLHRFDLSGQKHILNTSFSELGHIPAYTPVPVLGTKIRERRGGGQMNYHYPLYLSPCTNIFVYAPIPVNPNKGGQSFVHRCLVCVREGDLQYILMQHVFASQLVLKVVSLIFMVGTSQFPHEKDYSGVSKVFYVCPGSEFLTQRFEMSFNIRKKKFFSFNGPTLYPLPS